MDRRLPQKDERWIFDVEVEARHVRGGHSFVCYRPLYSQQRGALRELPERTFMSIFFPERGRRCTPRPGSRWVLTVMVRGVDPAAR